MKKLNRFLLTLLLTVTVVFHYNTVLSQSVTVVQNRRAKACIVIPLDASDQLKDAAGLLQQYILRGTNAVLPVSTSQVFGLASIHLGETNFVKTLRLHTEDVDEDGFIFKTIDSKNFVILGGSDWGTEFGVYNWLEKYVGVHWFLPTSIGTNISLNKSIIIPAIEKVHNPVFLSREISPINIHSNTPLSTWGRFNFLRGRVKFHHNLLNLFDPKDFLKTNPDFYPSDISKLKSSPNYRWQPNFTAPGIADSAGQKIIRFFKANPKEKSYSLGINDTPIFDQSAASLKRRSGKINYLGLEDVSDDYFAWANKVVEAVNKVFPDKLFGLLAYNNVAEPPSHSVGVNPNIIPFITYERFRWADSTLQKKGHELNDVWRKEAKMLGWYDYTYGLNYLAPRIWFHEMQDYLKWGAEHKVKYYYAELYPNWGEGPKPWVQAKLLWNPNYDLDSLLNVWYLCFAGERAAPELAAFYSIWETFWTKDIFSSRWNTDKGQYLPFKNYSYLDAVPKEYVEKADGLMKAALQKAPKGDKHKRVEKLNEMWQIYKTAITIYQNADQKDKNKVLENSPQFYSLLKNLENDPIHGASVKRIMLYMNLR